MCATLGYKLGSATVNNNSAINHQLTCSPNYHLYCRYILIRARISNMHSVHVHRRPGPTTRQMW